MYLHRNLLFLLFIPSAHAAVQRSCRDALSPAGFPEKVMLSHNVIPHNVIPQAFPSVQILEVDPFQAQFVHLHIPCSHHPALFTWQASPPLHHLTVGYFTLLLCLG